MRIPGREWLAARRNRPGLSLADLLEPDPHTEFVGIEHEYRVFDGDRQVDFREVIHTLGLPRPFLDPGDLNAYWLPSGTKLTADEREAEIATPPEPVEPGFTSVVVARAAEARRDLQALLPPTWRLEGYSTHINVSVDNRIGDRVALDYAETFAPALMLLMDAPTSPGLLIRPRPGRLELGGEFAEGEQLAACVAFAVGSVRATIARRLPPTLRVRLAPDDRRFGWYVDRRAFGPDLYRDGRSARLTRRTGKTRTAQAHLKTCWVTAKRELRELDLPDIDRPTRIVGGEQRLPAERSAPGPAVGAATTLEPSPNGELICTHTRPDYSLAPVMATWDTIVFAILTDDSRTAVACVPHRSFGSALGQLRGGGLDGAVSKFFARRPSGRILGLSDQARHAGLWDGIKRRSNLLARERWPHEQRHGRRSVRQAFGWPARTGG